jgi:HPt (histidine-containing phosphotransfer) domain-containing protein
MERDMDATPAIDESALDAIRSLQQPGSECLLEKIISLFLEDSERLRASIAQALDSANADGIAAAAHSLKSSSANVGAVQVSAISNKMELAARGGDVAAGPALFEELVAALTTACARLETYLTA